MKRNTFARIVIMAIAVIFAVVGLSGCGVGVYSARDGHYTSNGITLDPNGSTQAVANAAARHMEAEAYATAVREGRASPTMNRRVTDQSFFFGGAQPVVVSPTPARPAAKPAKTVPNKTPSEAKATASLKCDGEGEIDPRCPATVGDVAAVLKVADNAANTAGVAVSTLRKLREREENQQKEGSQ